MFIQTAKKKLLILCIFIHYVIFIQYALLINNFQGRCRNPNEHIRRTDRKLEHMLQPIAAEQTHAHEIATLKVR